MKQLLFTLSLFVVIGVTNAQVKYSGYYTDNDGKEYPLQLLAGGKYLQEYIYTIDEGYDPTTEAEQSISTIVYYKNGTLFPRRKRENIKKFKARFFEEDSLLSNMALNNDFDEICGNESSLIFAEYDKWIDSLQYKNVSDTTVALRGILDADKYYKHIANKYFWKTFWIGRLLTPIVGLPYGIHQQKIFRTSNIVFTDTTLESQPEYVNAYEARAFTLKKKSITKGLFMSLIP